jgi:hypothetical protein
VTVKFFEPEPLRAGHRSTSIFAELSPEVTDLRRRCWAMVMLTGKCPQLLARSTLSRPNYIFRIGEVRDLARRAAAAIRRTIVHAVVAYRLDRAHG